MSLLSNLFKSDKLKVPVDLSLIGTDMHSHLIPGIDDGTRSMEESIELIQSLYDLGYKKIITTPHIISSYFKNTPAIIKQGLEALQAEVAKHHIPIKVEAAAEYMFDENFTKKFHDGELMTFGDKYVLMELSAYQPPDNLFQVLFDMKLEGYNPILAHPERYAYFHDNVEHYVSLKDREIYFQINMLSLSGFHSQEVRKIAEYLIDNNMIEFAGTDLHNANYLENIEKSRYMKYLEKLVNSGCLLNKKL